MLRRVSRSANERSAWFVRAFALTSPPGFELEAFLTQGELFGPATPGASRQEPAAARRAAGLAQEPQSAAETPFDSAISAAEELRGRLQQRLGLWIDPFTAQYLLRAMDRGEETIEFIAADARSGRSAFHVLPAVKLKSM